MKSFKKLFRSTGEDRERGDVGPATTRSSIAKGSDGKRALVESVLQSSSTLTSESKSSNRHSIIKEDPSEIPRTSSSSSNNQEEPAISQSIPEAEGTKVIANQGLTHKSSGDRLDENTGGRRSSLSYEMALSKAEKVKMELEEARNKSREVRLARENARTSNSCTLKSEHTPSSPATSLQESSDISSDSLKNEALPHSLEASRQTMPVPPSEEMKLDEDRPSGHNSHLSAGLVIPDEPPNVVQAYDQVPLLEKTMLPRGGASVDTKAVGRVQFGIPPETIKDSMKLGIPVPQVYIVPVDRFCRELGPALGVNLAEFEFPAYFNFFVYKKKCTLVVDSDEAEDNIRKVFGETLLGPEQFRRDIDPLAYEEEDFAPSFPREAIPNFQKEFKHFRIMPDGKELEIETLLTFYHFKSKKQLTEVDIGIPPNVSSSSASTTIDHNDDVEDGIADPIDETDSEKDDDLAANMFSSERAVEKWLFSPIRHICDVATVWPANATVEQIASRSVPRVEIFKMPGGTEYFIHDIDAQGTIIGKARFAGQVRVSELMSVDGFGGHSIMDDLKLKKDVSANGDHSEAFESVMRLDVPPTFHPPSFGVTVLGNSHGFDKSGSVSGYVLWINGRGVMIDPPPYSSATLEREGIRPRAIVGIILTHCHADHDAGAFQKVLTGSPVVVITTPTIYKSFIRKYAALSALNPAILRRCHRFKPAIIGQPLRFQGATFRFMYSLHTIPCVGFRVEWRGRSMVFTGDHFNSPEGIDQLQESGVLSQARADDLRSLPLQECDLILHEAGAPPIHTPLEVLMKLPKKIKDRLYVVHTAALPDNCDLRVAPTGTAGTIRLDELKSEAMVKDGTNSLANVSGHRTRNSEEQLSSVGTEEAPWTGNNEYGTISEDSVSMGSSGMMTSLAHMAVSPVGKTAGYPIGYSQGQGDVYQPPPLVSLRPASSTDAWFILNLLSAVPFLSSLSYTHTMEVLETARVDAYVKGSVVVPASKRSQILCVVWEGTCAEQATGTTGPLTAIQEESVAIWHAGDWTGPISLQPDRRLSGESPGSATHDIVALSSVGVKVITIDMPQLHAILKAGSPLYGTYMKRMALKQKAKSVRSSSSENSPVKVGESDFNVMELLNSNSALKKLNAVQKRHLECLAEGPMIYSPGEKMWSAGTSVDKAFLVVSGSCSFDVMARHHQDGKPRKNISVVSESIRLDAQKVMNELSQLSVQPAIVEQVPALPADYDKLSQGLKKRADYLAKEGPPAASDEGFEDADLQNSESRFDHTFTDDNDPVAVSRRESVVRRRSSRARHANKVLGRLYGRQTLDGLVFSRGHFLGDMSKMVFGLLANDVSVDSGKSDFAFGEKSLSELFTAELDDDDQADEKAHLKHSSTLVAGKDGCVAFMFSKSSLVGFLDQYPGFLLSLLGTQAIV